MWIAPFSIERLISLDEDHLALKIENAFGVYKVFLLEYFTESLFTPIIEMADSISDAISISNNNQK